jgi:hypothetical protein
VIAPASAGLRPLALRKGRELWSGLAVLRSRRGAPSLPIEAFAFAGGGADTGERVALPFPGLFRCS